MNYTELKHIISESIKQHLLQEYRGEQLMIPFDGNTKPYNYMQYVDFIKRITREGTLKSKITSKKQYINSFSNEKLFEIGMNIYFYPGYVRDNFDYDEYNFRIDELENKYGKEIYGKNNNPLSNRFQIGEELSDFGFQKLEETLINVGKSSLSTTVDYLTSLNNNSNMIPINRVISIPKAFGRFSTVGDKEYTEYGGDEYKDFYSYLLNEFGGLGDYWAYGYDTGEAYRGDSYDGGTDYLRIIGYVPLEYINIADTCGADITEESEIYFTTHAKLLLTTIEINGKKINIGNRIYEP